MSRCEHVQAELLEHLYDLLEPADSQALLAHMAGCAACQAALKKAQEQQRLLVAATRAEFPAVRFEPPADDDEPVALPARGAPREWRLWAGWAVAASVFLALGGLGLAGGAWYLKGRNYHSELAQARANQQQIQAQQNQLWKDRQERIARASTEVAEAEKNILELGQQQQKQLAEANRRIQDQKMYLAIRGPESIQAGAPNEFQIEVRNLNNGLVPAQLQAKVIEVRKSKATESTLAAPAATATKPQAATVAKGTVEAAKVVFEDKAIQTNGRLKLSLPRNLEVKPDSDLYLEVVAQAETGKAQLSEKLSLGKPVYVTHLATDKPMYQPGETVYFRSLTLERFSLKPAAEDMRLIFSIHSPLQEEIAHLEGLSRLVDEQRREVMGPDKQPVRGIGSGQFELPATLAGGEYTLTVSDAGNRFQPENRKFIVNRYQPHKLNKQLEFTKKSYGPGETVVAACKVAQGDKPLIGKPATATISVDGKQYDVEGREKAAATVTLPTDATGGVSFKFKLPAQIERGEASLAVQFSDGGHVESIVRPIPIVLKKLLVEFFPEGGDLVAGVPNRVYFQARTLLGKPAELTGRIVDASSKEVAAAQTLNDDKEPGANQGMGVFEFTPQAGSFYELKIDTPGGIEGQYRLPNVTSDGVVLNVPGGVTTAQEPIRVVLRSAAKDRNLLVGAYCRGRLLDHNRVTVKKGESAETLLRPEAGIGGVYRITVFEEHGNEGNRPDLVPVAERLIFRQGISRLNLGLKPDKKSYMPGDSVELAVRSTDEKGNSAPAILMVAVVDKSVLTMADEKTARTMPTHFLLTSEVRRPEDLEFADFLLTDHAKATEALDLLLGTQGWRRFAEQNPREFQNEHKQEAERLFVAFGQEAPTADRQGGNAFQYEHQKIASLFRSRFEEQYTRLSLAEDAAAAAEGNPAYQQELDGLNEQAVQAGKAVVAAQVQIAQYDDTNRQLRSRGLVGLGGLLLFVGLAALVLGLVRSIHGGLPYLATGICSVALCAVVLLAAYAQYGRDEIRPAVAEVAQAPPTAESRWVAPADNMDRDNAPLAEAQARRAAAPPAPAKLEDEALRVVPVAPQEIKGFLPAGADKAKAANGLMPPRPANAAVRLEKAAQPNAKQDQVHRPELAKLGDAAGKKRGLQERFERKDAAEADGKAAGGMALKRVPEVRQRLNEPAKEAPLAPADMPPGGPMWERDRQLMLRERLAQELPPPAMMVREYRHHRIAGSDPVIRTDATETLLWQPALVLANGAVQLPFQLNDQTTSFQVTAYGHTTDGRIGAGSLVLNSRLPFSVEPKVPLEVTATDKIDLPVAVANDSDDPRAVNVRLDAVGLSGGADERLQLGPNQRTRRLFRLQPQLLEGDARITVHGLSEPFAADTIVKTIRVVPDGFPVVGSHSDLLEKVAHAEVNLPDSMVKGTLQLQASVYVSTLADLQKGLDSLLREPCGCFEQTSTSNYPNLLILDYLRETDQARPEVARRARDLLDRGYQKLTSFECMNTGEKRREGYEWFGGTAPAHEALTAYGLLQFRDMARVYDVDPVMVERTRRYLLARKDNNGGFLRNPRALDTFGRAPDDITNAYIVWALTESGPDDDVTRELDKVTGQARDSKDPYFVALVANSLLNRSRTDEALALLRKLAPMQTKEGLLDGARISITGSGGRDLQIEATALGLLAWLKSHRPEFTPNVQAAIRWIQQQRGGYGGFGSTQSTILALKALITHAKENKKTPNAGELIVSLGGQVLARKAFPRGAAEAITLDAPHPEQFLKAGKNDLQVELTGGNTFPFTLSWTYRTVTPASADQTPVRLTTKLNRTQAAEGETVRLTATVANATDKGQGMTVAIIGLPAGLTLPEDFKQLKDYAALRNDGTEPGLISAWETRGRELILYWRDLAPNAKIDVNLDLICRVPGAYRGPASRAYLYYNADVKHWIDPLAVEIAAKSE